MAGVDLAKTAAKNGTPLYVYDLSRVAANLRRAKRALKRVTSRSRVFYAMKSNRHPEVLKSLRLAGVDGIDVCSPAELQRAVELGFRENQISYTGTAMSEGDADVLMRFPGVALNCDSLSSIRKIGLRDPGRNIGIRIDPSIGVGYRQNRRLQYAGNEITKFGIPIERVGEAIRLAASLQLEVGGLHVHAGCGFLTPQLPQVRRVMARVAELAATLPALRYLNLGGGWGIPLVKEDKPLDLERWALLAHGYFGTGNTEVWVEPGDYLVKDSGVLLLTVTEIERRQGREFVGLDGGFNLHPEPVFYDLPLEPVPLSLRNGRKRRVTLAGNINEAHDLWYQSVLLPPLKEGDVMCFLNAGGYGASMASNHCMRGSFKELALK